MITQKVCERPWAQRNVEKAARVRVTWHLLLRGWLNFKCRLPSVTSAAPARDDVSRVLPAAKFHPIFMSSPLRPQLHRLYLARRQVIFKNHARIARSIFRRPCSCTASLYAESEKGSDTLTKGLDATTKLPKPPADHRELAVTQGLFTTSVYSPGSPLFLPNGSDMLNKLAACLRAHYPQFGFREVITPNIYKKSLWEKSGHWDKYSEDMFEAIGRGATGEKADAELGEDESFGLKPMNCPGHCLVFASEKRSYRDLPIRYADFSALHRNEISGALSGLTRVRRFHQDDGHIFCRPSQIKDEIKRTMAFIDLIYSKIFRLGPYRLVLSTRPANYIGTVSEWNSAEQQLKTALDHTGLAWTVNEGDGAFYGPKIDIILKDSDGKEHQTATIQLDFQLPQRFNLSYVSPQTEPEHRTVESTQGPEFGAAERSGTATPVLIHRAVLGSLERFLALLIEQYDGCYPFWISPRPVTILSVGQTPEELSAVEKLKALLLGLPDNQVESIDAQYVKTPILRPPIQVDVDTSSRSLAKKVREAKSKGYNFIVVVGPKDVSEGKFALMVSTSRNRPETLEILMEKFGKIQEQKPLRLSAQQIRILFEQVMDKYL